MKTVKVRIGVSVNKHGEWFVMDPWTIPGRMATDDEIRERFEEMDPSDDEILHFIEAELPVPESVTVVGSVEPGSKP